jgi:hypothetical protein
MQQRLRPRPRPTKKVGSNVHYVSASLTKRLAAAKMEQMHVEKEKAKNEEDQRKAKEMEVRC